MSMRSIVQSSVLVLSLALVACSARTNTNTGGGGGGAGGGSGGGAGGGGGGGTMTVDAGSGKDGGTAIVDAGSPPPETIAAAKSVKFPALVNLKGVVVTAVPFAAASNANSTCAGTSTKGVNASFWIADPNNAHSGIFVTKFRCDPPADYLPAIGDVLDLKGYIGIESKFDGRERSRFVVKQQFDFINPTPSTCALPTCQPLEITKTGTMAPLADSMVDGTFGNDGAIRSNTEYAGSRVKITADLSIANASPLALKRASLLPNDDRYFGFELSNHVLVNNYLTFATFAADGGLLEDGGTSSCDFRLVVLDGGSVTFSSIAGVWDSYTFTGCQDGGVASNCFKHFGVIPGTDAGYTYVLYPTSCADFVVKP